MENHIAIRKAGPQDAEKVIEVHFNSVHAISDSYSSALLDSWSPPPSASRYDWMRSMINSPQFGVLVAESGSEVCAFSIYSITDSFIKALYVDPRKFRRGVGKTLLAHTEHHLAQAGCINLKVNASNNAVGFYKSNGYSAIGPSTQVLGDGSQLPCYEMQKQVPNTSANPDALERAGYFNR